MQLTIISATIAVAIAVGCAWYCRRLAVEKGRNALVWTVLGFALTVIAVPLLVLLPGPRHTAGDERVSDGAIEPSSSLEQESSLDGPD